jgi:hypothetical protein
MSESWDGGSDNNSGLTKGGAMVGVGCLALRLGKPVGSNNCAQELALINLVVYCY